MNVIEVIQKSASYLAKRGIDNPRLEAETLLASVLAKPRLQLYLGFERKVSSQELDMVREFVKRRGGREPLQHILGSISFCGLEMTVSRDVLVPRPETELLAERAWAFLATCGTPEPDVLDFGTGSGCLAVTLAKHCPSARIQALDISAAALEVAHSNASAHGVESGIQFRECNGLTALPTDLKFDLIVSNPPYIPSGQIDQLEPEVKHFDPRIALDGGAEGMDFHRLLASEARDRIWPEGRLMLEIGDGQDESVRTLFEQHKWIVEAVEKDYTGRPRILIAGVNPNSKA